MLHLQKLLTILISFSLFLIPTVISSFKVNTLSSQPRLIPLDSSTFNEYTTPPRNYSLYISLTALAPEMGCAPCRDFDKEFQVVANSWSRLNKGENEGRMYFGRLDFKDGREVFQKVCSEMKPTRFKLGDMLLWRIDFDCYFWCS